MKTFIIFITFLVIPGLTIAQKQRKEEPLSIGQSVPATPLGTIIRSTGTPTSSFEGKSSLSDFKGKLVILDFWTTFCSPCISNFEYMSKLQEYYKDDIQIFLVNAWESEDYVTKWRKKRDSLLRGKTIIPENLPVIVSKNIGKLFPVRGDVGYHVWIGKDGKYILRGISENTYPDKIDQYLSGLPLNFIRDGGHIYNSEYPYANTKSISGNLGLQFLSYFGGFNDSTANAYGQSALNKIDSASATRRNTFLNLPVAELYELAYRYALEQDTQVVFGSRMELQVKDPTRITLDREWLKAKVTDESYRKACYSYEQIVPVNVPESTVFLMMRNDLDNYFGQLLNIRARLVQQKRNCLVLKIADQGKLRKSNRDGESRSIKGADGKLKSAFYGYTIQDAMRAYLQFNQFLNSRDVVMDISNIGYKVDLELPPIQEIKTIEQFRAELKKMGIDVIREPQLINTLIVAEI